MRIPSRLAASSLFVVLALGGASLAVAADTTSLPPTIPPAVISPTNQPRPALSAVDLATADLAQAARETAGNLQALNLDATRAAMARGDAASDAVLSAGHGSSAATAMTDAWARMRIRSGAVVALLANLQAHDAAVINATARGRSADWGDALDYLGEAAGWLGQAQTARAALAVGAATDTFGQLIDRDSSYDAALNALYSYMAKSHDRAGRKFAALSKAVVDAQAALPASNDVLSFIVGESAAATLYTDLLSIERDRSDVLAASLSNP